jgi:hypothetical protein
MKTIFLFPHTWRKAGIALFLTGLLVFAISNFYAESISNLQTAQYSQGGKFDFSVLITDVILLTLISGLLLIGFSKEQTEDEQIFQLRLSCLQWSMYLNYLVLILSVVFINGLHFFYVIVYNMFTPLLFFTVVFRWRIYQLNRLTAEEDAI